MSIHMCAIDLLLIVLFAKKRVDESEVVRNSKVLLEILVGSVVV